MTARAAMAAVVALTVGVAMLSGCGGSRGSAPESRVLGAQDVPRADPVARKTIGPGGGKLSAEGFSLQVPAGAFSAPAQLALYRIARAPGVSERAATGAYNLAGLPTQIAKPLKVTLQMPAGRSASGFTFLSLSERGWSKTGGLVHSLLPLEATVSKQSIVGYLPATGGSAREAPAQGEGTQSVALSAFTRWRALTSANKRFRVIFHPMSCEEAHAAIIAECAENAYKAIADICGLSWARRTRYPIDITVRAMPGGGDLNTAETAASLLGVNYISICADSSWCDTDQRTRELAIMVEHEIMHVAQYLYDPRNRVAVVSRLSPWLWMDEATATYFEYHRGVDRVPQPAVLPIPSAAKAHYDFLMYHGLEYPPPANNDAAQKLVQRHGYGASMLLNYLEAYQGFSLLNVGNMYKAYYAKANLRPCEALSNAVGGNQTLGARFNDFVDKWMQGTVYGPNRPRFPDAQRIVGLVAATGRVHRFRNGQSVSPRFEGQADDLSIWPVILYVPGGLPNGSTLLSVLGGDGLYFTGRCYSYRNKTQPLRSIGATGTDARLVLRHFEDVGNSVLMVCVHHGARSPFTSREPCWVQGQVKPIITKVTPPSGPVGTSIVIDGWGFGPAAGANAWCQVAHAGSPVISWSNTRIETKVQGALNPGPTWVSVTVEVFPFTYPPNDYTAVYPFTITGS